VSPDRQVLPLEEELLQKRSAAESLVLEALVLEPE
jgi:hypothetical protein